MIYHTQLLPKGKVYGGASTEAVVQHVGPHVRCVGADIH